MASGTRSAAAYVAVFVVAGIAIGMMPVLLEMNPVEGSPGRLNNHPLLARLLFVLSLPGNAAAFPLAAFAGRFDAFAFAYLLGLVLGQSVAYAFLGAMVWLIRSHLRAEARSTQSGSEHRDS